MRVKLIGRFAPRARTIAQPHQRLKAGVIIGWVTLHMPWIKYPTTPVEGVQIVGVTRRAAGSVVLSHRVRLNHFVRWLDATGLTPGATLASVPRLEERL